MSRRNRADFSCFIAILFLFFFVVALPSSQKSSASEAEWTSVVTENAGLLSLPADWKVISRDEATERSPGEEFAFNVQQVLYAEPEGASTDLGASLQVFSIWSSDPEGRVASLPPEILEQAGEDLIGGLINGRYGHVRQLSRNMLNTHLDDIPVTTWGIDSSENSGIRYKGAALFHGEKLVLVLGRYLPDYETPWSRQFEDIISRWMASLTLTPGPMPEALMAEIPLPDTTVAVLPLRNPEATQALDILFPEDVPAVPALSSDISSAAAIAAEIPSEAETADGWAFVYYGVPAFLAALIFGGMLVGRIAGKRRSSNERLSSFQEIVPVPITSEELRTRGTTSAVSFSPSLAVAETSCSDLSAIETPAIFEPSESDTDKKAEEILQEIHEEDDNEPDFSTNIRARCGFRINNLFSFTRKVSQEIAEDADEVETNPDIDADKHEKKNDPADAVSDEHPTEIEPAVSDWRKTTAAPLFVENHPGDGDESVAKPAEPLAKHLESSPEEVLPEKAACLDSQKGEKTADEEEEKPEEAGAEKLAPSHPFDLIRAEDMEFPPLSSTYDDPSHPSVWGEAPATETLVQSVPEEAGFEKVYTLINQALDILESYKDVMPTPRYYSNMPETPITSSMPVLREKAKNVAEKEPLNVNSISGDTDETLLGDLIAEESDPYRLKWLYICAFALMTIADVTVAVLSAQISNAERLLSQLLESIPVLLEKNFILMGVSCLLALAVRFAILRRPMHRGGLHLLVSTLSVAFGTSVFSLGTLFFLSVLPNMGIMQGCAMAVSFYLSYRTLTYRYIDDMEEEHTTGEVPVAANTEMAVSPRDPKISRKETEADTSKGEKEWNALSIRHSDDLFKELEASFGTSYILDLLEDEIRNALENEEGSLQLMRAQDVDPDFLILKLCCSTLINLMHTGRYHVGQGILSSEGQELLDLFNHIADRLLRSGYSSPEELCKDSDLMQRYVQEQG